MNKSNSINLLVTYKEVDVAICKMLEILSCNPIFHIYIATPISETGDIICGHCTALHIPPITSKFTWSAIHSLRRLIKEYNIHLIYSPSSSGLSNALFASWGTQARNVAYRGTQAKISRIDLTYYLGILNPRVNHVVCETPDIRESLSRFISHDKLSVSLKPFDIGWVEDACHHAKHVDGIPDDAFKCIYIGATKGRPYKGLTDLINAFLLLDDRSVHLIIIGEYGESDYSLAKHSKLSNQIHFLGYRSDAISFLPSSGLFILPSLRDASPRVVREAMACGVPCVVTDIPGARDLIVNRLTGVLVPPASPQEMANAIKTLLEDREKLAEMGIAAREHIIRHFGVDAYVSYFEGLFKTLI